MYINNGLANQDLDLNQEMEHKIKNSKFFYLFELFEFVKIVKIH